MKLKKIIAAVAAAAVAVSTMAVNAFAADYTANIPSISITNTPKSTAPATAVDSMEYVPSPVT